MPELPVPLSSVALRLAGEVGQTALDEISLAGVTAAADLDQHIAAIRAELTPEREPAVAAAQLAGLAAGRSGRSDRASRQAGGSRLAGLSCPDVPFVASAVRTEAVLPLRLLLH